MISFLSFIKNNTFSLRVIPNASKTELIEENHRLKLYLKAQPQKGKANDALIKFFKKEYKLKVEIKRGKTSKDKVIEIKK
jgi:uncharacterized protein (TIGR00251 family)